MPGIGARLVSLAVPVALSLSACGAPADAQQREAEPTSAEQALSEVQALLEGHTDRQEEQRILEILAGLAAAELNLLLRELNLPALLDGVDDRPVGPDHYSELLALLTVTRLAELDLVAKAVLIDVLQEGDTDVRDEVAVRNLVLGTSGAALTELKNRIDGGPGYRDLLQLVYHDLDDAALRDEVLAHIVAEAAKAPTSELKVLSDIDDTIYASWKDERYPSRTFYPGVVEFYRQLDLGSDGSGREGDLVFVTARPGDRLGLVEDATLEILKEAGFPHATVLAGGFTRLHSHDAIAAGKLENFRRFQRLYPEYRFVFTGDSGQADAIFGAAIAEQYPEAVAGVFIHDVVATPEAARAEWLEKGVVFFDTYAGVAVAAHQRGLISLDGLHGVTLATSQQMSQVAFESAASRQARRAELERDLRRANERLPPERRIELSNF